MQLAVLNTLYNSSATASAIPTNDIDPSDEQTTETNKESDENGIAKDSQTSAEISEDAAEAQLISKETPSDPNTNTIASAEQEQQRPMEATDFPADDAPLNSLLRRAKEAESTVEKLKRQLALMLTVQQQSTSSAQKKSSDISSAIDGAEIRRLHRRIKELENQVVVAKSSSQHGNDGVADKKALAAIEKQLQKKIKDLETAFKKERTMLESRAIKAEKAYETTSTMLEPVTKERDLLRAKTKDMVNMNEELSKLRKQSEQFAEVSSQLEQKTSDYAMLSEQFKREAALRKKYKNELEDLKGAIRVFARCRPMAQYELDNKCKQAVVFKDEMSLKLFTNRGERDFEFDSVFHTGSTQDQVFEDAKRLVESCIDGFNVCIFACKLVILC
jgi:myosin heavy subunit